MSSTASLRRTPSYRSMRVKHCQALLYVSTGEFWSLTLTVSKAYPLHEVNMSATDVHEG